MSHRLFRTLSLAALSVLTCSAVAYTGWTPAAAPSGSFPVEFRAGDDAKGKDTIIFRRGNTIVGKIVSETATKVRFKGEINGIPVDTEYDKAEILKIIKGAPVDDKAPTTATPASNTSVPTAAADPVKTPEDVTGKKRVYVLPLEGRFGRQISETPLREALKDAQKLKADIIVVSLENEWKFQGGEEAPDSATAFNELFRAEKIGPIFSDDTARWDKTPQVVFWVKKAMGGAAFLPFYSKDIYFSAEGRMGGIGALKQLLEGMGDEVFREKQYSLRLAHARGVAINGGYDWRIINAMCVTEYILSVKYTPEPVYFERMPEGPDEVLLTDDGKESNGDPIKLLIAGEGNDVLTLTSKLARDLRISKGTVDTLEDLLTEMGLGRNWTEIKEGKSKQISERWKTDFENGIRDLNTRLPQKIAEIQAGGTFQERTKARSQRKRILQEMIGVYKKFREVFGEEQADGQIADINTQIELLEQEQQRDAQEQRKR